MQQLCIALLPHSSLPPSWSAVTQREVEGLYKRFRSVDRGRKGYINADEFLAIPELSINPLASRLVRVRYHVESHSLHLGVVEQAVEILLSETRPHAHLLIGLLPRGYRDAGTQGEQNCTVRLRHTDKGCR